MCHKGFSQNNDLKGPFTDSYKGKTFCLGNRAFLEMIFLKDIYIFIQRKSLMFSFSETGSLKTHLRTHMKKKPYVCVMCNKGFCQKCNLKRHLWVHTKKNNCL
ncbi:UNVERIFIED_CONTAM: Myoneurin [Trichonephila clavipes]